MSAFRLFGAVEPASPTVFAPRALMQTLFTQAEQLGFAGHPLGILFIGYIAASPSIDIADPEFKADLAQAVAAELITQARADQVLAGTPAPTGS